MGSEGVVVLAIIDAVLVGMFFLFRVLPWSRPGPWRLIWITASLAFVLFSLGETSAMVSGGAAVAFEVQAPLFGAILATTTCLILVYVHGVRLSQEAIALALVDELTRLPNSRAFEMRLATRLRDPDPFSVAYLHFQGLGAVNDLFGTDRGDSVLRGLADLLRAHATARDVVARLGPDQFAMLFAGPDERASGVARDILAGFRALAQREAGGVDLRLAVGMVSRSEASDARRLIRLAYRAMQEAESRASYEPVKDA